MNFKETWLKMNHDAIGTPRYSLLTTHNYTIAAKVKDMASRYVRGKILDAGAGRLAWREDLKKHGTTYVSIDKCRATEELDYECDIRALPFADGEFDTVFCAQVLEHSPEIEPLLAELSRVLKKNGTLILSVPHLSYLHGEPEDYYRFTRHGIRYLLEKRGFELLAIEPTGGILAFICTVPSALALSLVYRIPLLWPLAFEVNALFVKAICRIDRLFGAPELYPLDYVAAARKKIADVPQKSEGWTSSSTPSNGSAATPAST